MPPTLNLLINQANTQQAIYQWFAEGETLDQVVDEIILICGDEDAAFNWSTELVKAEVQKVFESFVCISPVLSSFLDLQHNEILRAAALVANEQGVDTNFVIRLLLATFD